MPERPLFPFQTAILKAVHAEITANRRRALIPAPTGAGKTVMAADLARTAVANRQRVLFLTHRRELILQASRKLHDVGTDHAIVAPGYPKRPAEPVQLASIPTLHRRAVRSNQLELPPADLLIVDEAHHCPSPTWRRLIDAYPDAILIGLTATPCRQDGRGLGGIFQTMIPCPGIPELIELHYLVPTKVYAPSQPDLNGVHTVRGDYHEGELASAVDKPKLVGDIIEHWLKLANRRRTIVFCVNVAHSVHLRDEFCKAGVLAEHLDGKTGLDQRDAMLARLRSGATEVICNCSVFAEGLDVPDIGAIVLARPTKSFALYRQMVGRGLRPAPGKDHLLVLDHAGATLMHDPVEVPVEWVLSEDKKVVRASQTSAAQAAKYKLVTCGECKAVFCGRPPCPMCGWRPMPKPQPVETSDEDLVEYGSGISGQRAYNDNDKRHFHAQLAYIQRQHGYAHGWIAHKYRERFGNFPPDGYIPDPVPPEPATVRWVIGRNIAWRKAQQRRRA